MLYTCSTLPDNLLAGYPVLKRRRGSRSGKFKRDYLDVVCAFDIETTRLSENYSCMYIWQFQIGLECTVIGRTWIEFKHFMRKLCAQIPEGLRVVTLVHNLSFEFQWLRGIYDFQPEEVFLVKSRKPLRVDMYDKIEMRCSYLHSGLRLETYLENMGVPDQKLTYDYSIKRYPWTSLTESEIEYCIHDVKGLVEAYMVEMQHDGDDLYTCPLTLTGYVRRDVRKVMYKYRYMVKEMLPDVEVYSMLREAFRGGDVHASRFYAGQAVPNVYSYDRSSSYPDVQINGKFPVTRFKKRVQSATTWEEMLRLINVRKRAVLARVAFWDIELKNKYGEGFPYISFDKARRVYGERLDNGRILRAEYLELTITDIDLAIILSQYKFRARKVQTLYYARYGELPEELKALIVSYYKSKTELKGVEGKELLYFRDKGKLNSIFGLSAQNPVKPQIKLVNGEYIVEDTPLEELLEEANKRAFFPYQWGVYTTALARFELFRGRQNVTRQGGEVVYQDTDSVKYVEYKKHVDWTKLNDWYITASTEHGAVATDKKGNVHYMGVFEPENGYPATFATRGAKKYVVDHNGVIEATISGVSKRSDGGRVSGGMELAKHGGLSAFLQKSFVFHEAGGVELKYNDTDRFIMRIDGHTLQVRQCVTINESTYDLHDTEEYALLLKDCQTLPEDGVQQYMFDTFGKNK